MNNEYLVSLIGRAVQVYKGGPDSNVGVLLDVNEDYLTLQKEDGEIIYYTTAHIKSIKENSKIRFNSILKEYDTTNILKAATFNELAGLFKDQTIRVNGKGPESKIGTLIDVKEDILVIYTEQDGLIFYNTQHLKSISYQIPKEEEEIGEENTEKEELTEEEITEKEMKLIEFKEVYEQISGDNKTDLMSNLKYSWIKINRKGPESIEGLLVEVNDEDLVLVVNNEIFRIANYHVKNFSLSIDLSEEQQTEEENAQQTVKQKSTNSSNNSQSDGNQDSSTYTKSIYEEKLYLAKMRRNKRMKRKAKQKGNTSTKQSFDNKD